MPDDLGVATPASYTSPAATSDALKPHFRLKVLPLPGYAGAPLLVLDGRDAGEQASGLTLAGGDSTVRGPSIQNFDYSGIYITGDGNNHVGANYLGVAPPGTEVSGNEMGVLVEGPVENVVGGTAPGAGNLISGNETGIYIAGRSASGNRVQGNTMGLDATGMIVLPNGQGITINGAPGNLVGTPDIAARNVIAALPCLGDDLSLLLGRRTTPCFFGHRFVPPCSRLYSGILHVLEAQTLT